MGAVELFLVAVGLSMDAFAVSVCKGLGMKRLNIRAAVIISLFFGGFQALMPCVGWILGTQFQKYIVLYDHWIAFAMLSYIGGKMIKDSVCDSQRELTIGRIVDLKELLILSVATSIDALAVGITLAFLNINIFFSAIMIGVTTFSLSFLGVVTGVKFGSRFEKISEIVGGVILIFIGFKILLEHLLGC